MRPANGICSIIQDVKVSYNEQSTRFVHLEVFLKNCCNMKQVVAFRQACYCSKLLLSNYYFINYIRIVKCYYNTTIILLTTIN